jgi:enoyl-CoA hydratase/carnithine racemase
MNNAVLYETRGHTAVITVNRPEAGNAVNAEVMEGLDGSLKRAAGDPAVRVLVLTGAGQRVFISGGDLKEYNETLRSEEDVYRVMSRMRSVVAAIHQFPKPVVAACNGAVRGGGAELACAAHFRIAARHATIGFVQVKLGICPGWGGGVLLRRIVGHRAALRMLLTGEVLSAEEAHRIGLFDDVADNETLMDRVFELAEQLSSLSPHAVNGILGLVQAMDDTALAVSMERESRLCASLWMTEEHDRAMRHFLQKRS